MFKAIFWDNDGTLVDTEPLYFKATQEVLKRHEIELTHDFYVNQQLKHNTSAFSLLDPLKIDIEKLREERNTIYSEMLQEEIPIIDGVLDTLEALHGKIPMGIVTSSRKVHFDQIMEAAQIRKYFDFFITAEDVSNHKPHPDSYIKALEITGFKPEECVAIEDTERGVRAAKSAGITCFAVPTPLSSGNDFSKADRVLKNVRELIGIIVVAS